MPIRSHYPSALVVLIAFISEREVLWLDSEPPTPLSLNEALCTVLSGTNPEIDLPCGATVSLDLEQWAIEWGGWWFSITN